MIDVLQPKAGETLVVSGAAGGVGNLVGQIGKIRGLTVIGIAGSDEKGKWLTEELGYDYFINYKADNVFKKLKEIAPEGVDCYFDNVSNVKYILMSLIGIFIMKNKNATMDDCWKCYRKT